MRECYRSASTFYMSHDINELMIIYKLTIVVVP